MSSSYHLRFTIVAAGQKPILQAFIKKFKPTLYIFGSETSKDGVEHCHAHLEYDHPPNKSLVSDWMIKHELKNKYYHREVVTTDQKNLIYVTKECDILLTNLSDAVVEKLKQENEAIEEDKKKQPCDKLIERLKKKYDADQLEKLELGDLREFIDDVYCIEWGKLAPTDSLVRQYIRTISKRLNILTVDLKLYYIRDL